MARFQLHDRVALFVQQERSDRDGQDRADLRRRFLEGFLFDQSDDRKRQRLDVTNGAKTVASRADAAASFNERRAEPLAAHFEQSETRDAAGLDARTVQRERLAHAVLDRALVLARGHVDEVDDHQAANVAQSQLTGDFVRSLEVRVERRLLDVGTFCGTCRVDVDRHQRFGRVDHDGSARRQANFPVECALDLAFDLVAVEERNAPVIQLHAAAELRHDVVNETLGMFLCSRRVDDDFADVVAHVVAQGADDDITGLVNQKRRFCLGRAGDHFRQLEEVVEVPLEFLGGVSDGCCTDNDAHVLGEFQFGKACAGNLAFFIAHAP